MKYHAYFDVSGRRSDPAIVVAGYVATSESWERFSERWAELLKAEGLSAFHMTDCETFHGEFADWTPDRRTRVLQVAHDIIQGSVAWAFCGGLLTASYQRLVLTPEDRDAVGSPAWLCLVQVHDHLARWARRWSSDSPVDVFFEDGDDCRGDIVRLHEARALAEPSVIGQLAFVQKAVAPAQAADMHAYEAWKQLINRRASGVTRPLRKSLFNLAYGVMTDDTYLEDEELAKHVKRARSQA